MTLTTAVGTVEAVHVVGVRGAAARSIDVAEVRENLGVVGDWRARAGSRRQLTVVDGDVIDDVARSLGIEIAPGASRRQVTVRGLDLNATVGKRLAIGDVVIDVTMTCDPCEQMETAIGPGGRAALEGRGGVCGRVITGGTIRAGDAARLAD